MTDFRKRYATRDRVRELIDSIEHIHFDPPDGVPSWMLEEARNFASDPPVLTVEAVIACMHDDFFVEPAFLRKGFTVRLLRLWLDRVNARRPDTIVPQQMGNGTNWERFEMYIGLATQFRFRPIWPGAEPSELNRVVGILPEGSTPADLSTPEGSP